MRVTEWRFRGRLRRYGRGDSDGRSGSAIDCGFRRWNSRRTRVETSRPGMSPSRPTNLGQSRGWALRFIRFQKMRTESDQGDALWRDRESGRKAVKSRGFAGCRIELPDDRMRFAG